MQAISEACNAICDSPLRKRHFSPVKWWINHRLLAKPLPSSPKSASLVVNETGVGTQSNITHSGIYNPKAIHHLNVSAQSLPSFSFAVPDVVIPFQKTDPSPEGDRVPQKSLSHPAGDGYDTVLQRSPSGCGTAAQRGVPDGIRATPQSSEHRVRGGGWRSLPGNSSWIPSRSLLQCCDIAFLV